MEPHQLATIKASIKSIPDYPKPGIMFRDITSLIQDGHAFSLALDAMTAPYQNMGITKIVGAEARGFIFGSCIAQRLGVGFIPVRKPHKLPRAVLSQDYQLEYGSDTLEIHTDALTENDTVLIVDDLLATGGTIEATVKLISQLKATIHAAVFVISLPDLGGEDKLEKLGLNCFSLLSYPGE